MKVLTTERQEDLLDIYFKEFLKRKYLEEISKLKDVVEQQKIIKL